MKKHPWIYSSILILMIWFVTYGILSNKIIPSPIKTGIYIINHIPLLSLHLATSLFRIVSAIAITVILGGMLGILTARNKQLDQWLSPLIYTLYPVPKIAFLPLLMLFLGLGNTSKITLVSLILFFQITITLRDSVKNIHPSYFLSIRSLGANKWQTYRHVILPAMLPNLFTALRISVGTSISVLFFAENFATTYGIGYFIMDSWLRLDYTGMFAGIIVISLMGSVIFIALDRLEARFCRW